MNSEWRNRPCAASERPRRPLGHQCRLPLCVHAPDAADHGRHFTWLKHCSDHRVRLTTSIAQWISRSLQVFDRGGNTPKSIGIGLYRFVGTHPGHFSLGFVRFESRFKSTQVFRSPCSSAEVLLKTVFWDTGGLNAGFSEWHHRYRKIPFRTTTNNEQHRFARYR